MKTKQIFHDFFTVKVNVENVVSGVIAALSVPLGLLWAYAVIVQQLQ